MPVDLLCTNDICCYWERLFSDNKDCYVKSTFFTSLRCFLRVRLQPACSAKNQIYSIFFQLENITVFIADRKRMQRTWFVCMVSNQVGLTLVCSAKSYRSKSLVFFFSDKEAISIKVSHNKKAGQTMKTQHFPADKTLTW